MPAPPRRALPLPSPPPVGEGDRVSLRDSHLNKAWLAVEIVGVKLNVATLIGILILIVLIHFISIPQLFQTIFGHA